MSLTYKPPYDPPPFLPDPKWDPDAIKRILIDSLPKVTKEVAPVVANIRIEKIENGYLVIYGKQGVPEKRKFAKDMVDIGEVVKAACVELELTPKA